MPESDQEDSAECVLRGQVWLPSQVHQLMGDVQTRHNQMRQLEASLLELHQVFLDMSILVNDQGDMINNIDHWVSFTELAGCHLVAHWYR